jgi:hypothetical protein
MMTLGFQLGLYVIALLIGFGPLLVIIGCQLNRIADALEKKEPK